MIVAGLGQVQLGQNAANVLFHRALGDPKPMGDMLYRCCRGGALK